MWLASVDGVVTSREEARMPVADDGLLRGDGAFEVLRLYAGRPFAWDEHLARLRRTCAGLRLDADVERLAAEARALLVHGGGPDGLLRLVLTRGGRRIALLEPLPQRGPTARVATITYAPSRVLDGLKTLSYAGNMLATRVAQERGADEALLVTPHGRVLEGPTWTFFWVRDGVLRTPPLADGILASVTRARLIEACDVAEEHCTLADVRAAREAFIASTVREVMPITAVDDIVVPEAPGPVTRAAHAAFRERVERELAAPA